MRKSQTEAAYQAHMASKEDDSCPLCQERPVIREFNHWKIIENRFPYDLVAEKSHLLVSKSHSTEEPIELDFIKDKLKEEGYYTVWIENFPKRQSVKHHLHFHLLVN